MWTSIPSYGNVRNCTFIWHMRIWMFAWREKFCDMWDTFPSYDKLKPHVTTQGRLYTYSLLHIREVSFLLPVSLKVQIVLFRLRDNHESWGSWFSHGNYIDRGQSSYDAKKSPVTFVETFSVKALSPTLFLWWGLEYDILREEYFMED